MPHPSSLRLAACSVLFSFTTLLSLAVDTPAPANPPAVEPAKPAASAVENAVVKIFATLRYPDPFKPWSKQAPQEITGSGVVIEGKRILTNAHVALYASQIQVQANQSGDKLSATIERKVVALEDFKEFWKRV